MSIKYKKTQRRGRQRAICARCKKKVAEGRVQVVLGSREPHPTRSGAVYPTVSSRSIGLCEECAIKIYEELVDRVNKI